MLNQINFDLLSFPLPENEGNISDQDISDTFFSNLNQQDHISCGVMSLSSNSMYDYNNVNHVSPLDVSFLPQNSLSTPLPTPNYCTPSTHPLQEELEEFLTPLISPAITPNYTEIYEFLDPPSDQYFTPLSSPALPPSTNNSLNDNSSTTSTLSLQNSTLLSQQLAQIEAKQQLLRDQLNKSPTSPVAYRKSPLALFSNRTQAPPSPLPFNAKKRPSLRQKIALASPQLHATQNRLINNNNNNNNILPTTPATPASLMKMTHQRQIPTTTTTTTTTTNINNTFTNSTANNEMVDIMSSLPPTAYISVNESTTPVIGKKRKLAPSSPVPIASSPRTLKPLISPFLQPDNNKSIFMPTIENRRSAHKVAEQRRRDTLKQSFDSLRKEITDVLITDTVSFENEEKKRSDEAIRDEKEREVKLMSKVLLLQHSYEYIVKLKSDGKLKDEKIESMQSEIDKLRLLANNKEK